MRRLAAAAIFLNVAASTSWSQGASPVMPPSQSRNVNWPTLYSSQNVELVSFGYVRTLGFGNSWNGGRQRCFQLPDAPAKYRLGNECQTYFEPGFTLTLGDRDMGPQVELNLRNAFIGTPVNTYDDWDVYTVEAWAALDDFASDGPLEGARIWAGQRFYYRQDAHIHDFYYWNGTGLGYGIDQIPFGRGELAVAVFEESSFDLDTALDEGTPYRRIEARIEDWKHSERVLFRSALDLRFAKDGRETRSDFGGLLTLETELSEVMQGDLSLTLQLGWGAGHGMNFTSDAEAKSGEVGARAVATYLTNRNGDFTMQATAVIEAQSNDRDWISLGARPIWRIAGDFHAALEPGLDITFAAGETKVLSKLTAALLWKPGGPDFYDRPSFRAFVTYADWNAAADRAGIGPSFDGTSGATYGVQVEHWW